MKKILWIQKKKVGESTESVVFENKWKDFSLSFKKIFENMYEVDRMFIQNSLLVVSFSFN